jgi:hypothetical protein
MTLNELFSYLSDNPLVMIGYFVGVPLTALLANAMSKGEGHESPWSYFYSILVFMVAVPGIFVTALAVYLFLFERGSSIFNLNLVTQVLPFASMIVTLSIVKSNVPFEYIPGFGKLSSLVTLIMLTFGVMYFLNKLNIVMIAWVNVPVHYLLIAFVGIFLLMRFTLKSLIS